MGDDLWQGMELDCGARRVQDLGYGGVDALSDSSAYGSGSGPVWLSHIDCEGFEARLEECKYFYGLGQSSIPPSCDHTVDAGVQCSSKPLPMPTYEPLPEHRHRSLSPERYRDLESYGEKMLLPTNLTLKAALDVLEATIATLETRRSLIEEVQLTRMSRLRLRLRRLAGKPDEQPAGACPAATSVASNDDASHTDTADVEIPAGLQGKLSPEMLQELRLTGVGRIAKPLEEERREFEQRRREENYDPLENDPVERFIREKREQYVPPGTRPAPLLEPKPREQLRNRRSRILSIGSRPIGRTLMMRDTSTRWSRYGSDSHLLALNALSDRGHGTMTPPSGVPVKTPMWCWSTKWTKTSSLIRSDRLLASTTSTERHQPRHSAFVRFGIQ